MCICVFFKPLLDHSPYFSIAASTWLRPKPQVVARRWQSAPRAWHAEQIGVKQILQTIVAGG